MQLLTIVELISSLTVIVGVFFALLEFRNYKAARKREAALTLMQSFMSPEYNEVIPIIFDMPEGLSPKEVVEVVGSKSRIFNFLSTFESLGILVYHREVSLDLVDDYFSSPVLNAWRKLRLFIEDWREENDRPVGWEWVEWLHDQMAKRESDTPAIPAYIEHRDWEA